MHAYVCMFDVCIHDVSWRRSLAFLKFLSALDLRRQCGSWSLQQFVEVTGHKSHDSGEQRQRGLA